MKIRLHLLLCVCAHVLTTPLSSQSVPGTSRAPLLDAVDSAAKARDSFREAREAMARKDTTEAFRRLAIAAHVWAAQPAYPNALMDLAMRANNEARAIEALQIANSMGYALPSTASAQALQKFQSSQFGVLLAQQDVLREVMNKGKAYRTLRDSTLFPEGLAVDPRNGAIYLSSIAHRNVLVIDRRGNEKWLVNDNANELGSLFGIAVDTVRDVLWAASAPNAAMRGFAADSANGKLAGLFAIRLSDGTIVKRAYVPTSVATPGPGDIALMNNGDVLMSDSQAGIVWWLQSAVGVTHGSPSQTLGDTLIAIRHRLLRSPQGIVPANDNQSAIVADYSHGLLRIYLATQNVIRVRDAAGHSTLGIDGLVRGGNKLIAIQNGLSPAQVLQLELSADGTRVLQHETIDRNALAPSPTGGVMINGEFVYIANSLWEMLDATGRMDSKAKLPKPLLLALPIGVVK